MGWKSIARALHPAYGVVSPRGGGDRAAQVIAHQASIRQAQNELDNEMAGYDKIPDTLRTAYTQSAQKAGTYGNTPEFQAGLNADVQAGTRGARVAAASRINALRRSLNMTEEFKPENWDATQGNATQDYLRNNPASPSAPAVTSKPETQQDSEEAATPSAPASDAPTKVQSRAPKGSARQKALIKQA